MRKSIWTVSLVLVISLSIAISSTKRNAKTYIMPADLVNLAEAHGFIQIDNFYTSHLPWTKPPFLWGYENNQSDEMSAIFWCQIPDDTLLGRSIYYLILARREKYGSNMILVDSIQWFESGGLTWFRDSTLGLDKFVYVNDSEMHGPKNAQMVNKAIKSSGEGFETVFYEYNGQWLVMDTFDRYLLS